MSSIPEWTVNDLLREGITHLTSSMDPPNIGQDYKFRDYKLQQIAIGKLLDEIGAMSAAAQGLNRVITTTAKLRNANGLHHVFLLNDHLAMNGKGQLIGLLKVGYKHLYLFDANNKVLECEPLCVLDFFILKDRQRSGYGRVLFDYMLNYLCLSPHHLPIDGPSPKMEQFLIKNYGMTGLIRQNNNFAVSPLFFCNTIEKEGHGSGRSTPAAAAAGDDAAAGAVGRFAASKPHSDIASVIHGDTSHHGEPPFYNYSTDYLRARRAMNSH